MKPPRCIVCGDDSHDATLVAFADLQPLPDGMTGHPHGLEWFCRRHAPLATTLRHPPIADAVARVKRHRWWPFGRAAPRSGILAVARSTQSHRHPGHITRMRILGIDPGLRLTGFGVVDVDGPRLSYVASGVVRTPDTDLPARLHVIFEGVREVVATHRPTCAAIEKVFVNVNPQSTLLLGQARGAAICGLMTAGIDVAEYTALQTKQATVGYGRATKAQMQDMVMRLLRLSGAPTADAADALACAICHAHTGASIGRLTAAAPDLAIGVLRIRRGRVGARG